MLTISPGPLLIACMYAGVVDNVWPPAWQISLVSGSFRKAAVRMGVSRLGSLPAAGGETMRLTTTPASSVTGHLTPGSANAGLGQFGHGLVVVGCHETGA